MPKTIIIEINEFLSLVNKNHLKIQLPVRSHQIGKYNFDFCWLVIVMQQCNFLVAIISMEIYSNGLVNYEYHSRGWLWLVIEGTIKINVTFNES